MKLSCAKSASAKMLLRLIFKKRRPSPPARPAPPCCGRRPRPVREIVQFRNAGQASIPSECRKKKPPHLSHWRPFWACSSRSVACRLAFVTLTHDLPARIGARYLARATLPRVHHYQRRKLPKIKKRSTFGDPSAPFWNVVRTLTPNS